MADLYGPAIAANLDTQKQVRARVVAFVSATWFGLGSWRDADIARFVALVVPMVLAGQRTIAQLTDSYLAMLAVQALGGRLEPTGLSLAEVSGAAVRNGTPPADVYHRAGVETWTALSRGASLDTAVQQGHDRAIKAVQTDMQLAKTHAAQQVMSTKAQVYGYRRVLTGPTSCGLCALASTQRYHKADLMPIHPACDCDVEPLLSPTGNVLDAQQLGQVHDLAAEFFGSGVNPLAASAGAHGKSRKYDYRDFVVVHQHGELGPVLARRGQKFTGPGDIAA